MEKRTRYWALVGITLLALVVLTVLKVPMLATLGIIVVAYAVVFVMVLLRGSRK